MSGIDGNQSSSFAALELLADPGKLQQKIDSLKQAEEHAREQIALAGPASEILQIRSEIDALKEEAEQTLGSARDDANEILDKANSDASFLRERADEESRAAREQADSVIAGAKKLADEAETAMAAVESKKQEVANGIDNLNSLGAELQQKADALDVRAEELKGKEEQLVKVRELINTVV